MVQCRTSMIQQAGLASADVMDKTATNAGKTQNVRNDCSKGQTIAFITPSQQQRSVHIKTLSGDTSFTLSLAAGCKLNKLLELAANRLQAMGIAVHRPIHNYLALVTQGAHVLESQFQVDIVRDGATITAIIGDEPNTKCQMLRSSCELSGICIVTNTVMSLNLESPARKDVQLFA